MANYARFKKILSDSFIDNTIDQTKVVTGAGVRWNTFTVYNACGFACRACQAGSLQSCGRCCLWTVPNKINTVSFELWSGGGAGPGYSGTFCCGLKSIGGAGGNYAIKTITTQPGCQYIICAGGSWPCDASNICIAGQGCASYVTGFNLNNFCTHGGCGGWACPNTDGYNPSPQPCANCGICGFFDADFGIMGMVGGLVGQSMCGCMGNTTFTGSAPFVGLQYQSSISEYWCNCGCFINWPSGGGISGISNYWGTCTAYGGTGGSGIVKVTFG